MRSKLMRNSGLMITVNEASVEKLTLSHNMFTDSKRNTKQDTDFMNLSFLWVTNEA